MSERVIISPTVGQLVAMSAYTDCFGKFHARIDNMTVQRVRKVAPGNIAPYHRLVATTDVGPVQYVEASARFFEFA